MTRHQTERIRRCTSQTHINSLITYFWNLLTEKQSTLGNWFLFLVVVTSGNWPTFCQMSPSTRDSWHVWNLSQNKLGKSDGFTQSVQALCGRKTLYYPFLKCFSECWTLRFAPNLLCSDTLPCAQWRTRFFQLGSLMAATKCNMLRGLLFLEYNNILPLATCPRLARNTNWKHKDFVPLPFITSDIQYL